MGQPQFIQIDPNALQQTAIDYNKGFYSASDADWAKRFPDLPKARDYTVANAASNLTPGYQDPLVTGALGTSGLGGTNFGTGNEFQQSRNLGQGVLQKEQRDRNYFQNLFAANPERSFGLNQDDYLNVVLANANDKRSFDQAAADAAAKAAYVNNQAGVANTTATIGAIGSGLSAISKFAQPSSGSYATAQSPYLNPSTYWNPSYYANANSFATSVPADAYSGGNGSFGFESTPTAGITADTGSSTY